MNKILLQHGHAHSVTYCLWLLLCYNQSWEAITDSIWLLKPKLFNIFSGGSVVKNLPVKQEARVLSLGQEDPLEKKMATHSSILAWEIPWTGEPGGLQSMGSHRVRHDEWLTLQLLTFGKIKLREHFVTTLKSNIIHYFFFFFKRMFFFLVVPHGMWDLNLSSPVRVWTCAPCIGSSES